MTGTLKKRGNVWYGVYRINGKQKWKSLGKNKSDARTRLNRILNDFEDGNYQELPAATFEEFSKMWLEIHGKPKLKKSTYNSYVSIIEKHLIPEFGDRNIVDMKAVTFLKYVAEKTKTLAPKTVVNHIVPLKKMFKHAVMWGYLKTDPCIYLERPTVKPEEMDFLVPVEILMLLGVINGQDLAMIMTAIYTGLRRGELFALKWDDIEFHTQNISVKRSLYEGEFIKPKTKSSVRRIVMSPDLGAALKIYKMEALPNKFDLLFPNQVGNVLCPDNWVKRNFKPALKLAKLRTIRFHDLRHTFATLLINSGENIKFIQHQMGHASIQTTMDRYGHLLPETSVGVGARLDAMIDPKKAENKSLLAKC